MRKLSPLVFIICFLSYLSAQESKAEKTLLEVAIDSINVYATEAILREIPDPQALLPQTTIEKFLSSLEKKGAKIERVFTFSFLLPENSPIELVSKPPGMEIKVKLSAIKGKGEEPYILFSLEYKEYSEELNILARQKNIPIQPVSVIDTGGYPGLPVPDGGITILKKRIEKVKKEEKTFARLLLIRGRSIK
ncbi:MAG: hypothetical protein ACPL7E_00275 [bacterium]